MNIAIQNAKGSAEGATSNRASSTILEGLSMNSVNNSSGEAAAPALITIAELQKEFEEIWGDLHDLQRKTYLLMGQLEADFDLKRAREIDGEAIVLMFQKRGIDVTTWLGGDVWSSSAALLEKADKLYDRIEALT